MSMPAPGTFIRPVGPTGFRYCLKVDRVIGKRVQCARWGMRNRLPVDDGHISQSSCGVDLLSIRPGVWREVPKARGWGILNTRYWVSTGDRSGQLDLFGGAA